MKVFGTSGELLFSAFLHNGRYFLDTSYYYGPNIVQPTRVDGVDAFVVADAKVDNSAELWHCRMGHANMPDIRRLQHLALGVQIPSKHKLRFCEPCVLSKLTNKPFQNMGEKPDRPKQIFGADVTGPHPKSLAGFQYLLEVICFYSGYGYSFPLKALKPRPRLQGNSSP